MKEFDTLTEIADTLLGPEGCPWDREQTMESLCPHTLEELCELIDAINLKDTENILEELGDLFFNVLFYCKLAEKTELFTTEAVLKNVSDKLIHRHPHVFGDTSIADSDAVVEQWEQIKKKEKKDRTSALEGIPKSLPSLARAQKVLKRIERTAFPSHHEDLPYFENEQELAQTLLNIATAAQHKGLNAELALKELLAQKEREFIKWEKKGV